MMTETEGEHSRAGEGVHLHQDDYRRTLLVLDELLIARRSAPPAGYHRTADGAWVDWDALEHSWLSSTEKAAVVVARGIAAAERQGGWPPRIRKMLADAVATL